MAVPAAAPDAPIPNPNIQMGSNTAFNTEKTSDLLCDGHSQPSSQHGGKGYWYLIVVMVVVVVIGQLIE